MNEILVLIAVLLCGLSGIMALPFARESRVGDGIASTFVVLGCVAGCTGAMRAVLGFTGAPLEVGWAVVGGALTVMVDALSGLFLLPAFLIAGLGAIYALDYWPGADNPRTVGRLRVFYGLVVAGIVCLFVARHAFLFLVGWEVMSFGAFLLVTVDEHERSVRESGFVYLIAARFGALCLLPLFLVLGLETGSLSLDATGLDGSSAGATAIFLLALVGFGLKAGLMPLHIWLPGAHANAPSHVSALMSGVVIKTGIYGLVRVCGMFEAPPLWWGLLVFGVGAVSAVLGVAFAIGQHDLKRLLAYHSVENIGIIALGFGVALLGQSRGEPLWVAMGLGGALLHVWNHGLFKSLLFFSAGSVVHRMHTRNLEAMGGLAKRMPRTAFAFLVGAVAICGLPPLNGFVSEFFVYLGLFNVGLYSKDAVGLGVLFGAPALALVGALATACFVKVVGVVFLGEPRTEAATRVKESPWRMWVPMAVLGACCVVIGTRPSIITPILDRAIAAWGGGVTAPSLSSATPIAMVEAGSSFLFVALLVVAALVLGLVSRRRRGTVGTWDCGYTRVTPRIQYTASSFGDWIVEYFAAALRPSQHDPTVDGYYPQVSSFHSHVPEVVLDFVVVPAVRLVERLSAAVRWVQGGQSQMYLVYVGAALVAMLAVWH